MQKRHISFWLFCATLVIACSAEKSGDKVIGLGSIKSSGNTAASSSGADAGGVNKESGASTDGTCGPAFDFATAKQQCTGCHAAAGRNAKWSTADGTEEQWKSMAGQLKASVKADRMPMPKFSADNKAMFISFLDGLTGACSPAPVAGGAAGGGAATNTPSDPKMMNLAEAKQKCAGCHIPGGPGAAPIAWNTANGTEDKWRERAQNLRAAVAADRMPPVALVEPEKSRMLAYLDRLLGDQANQPITYTLDTAKALCVGCHGASAPKKGLNLETLDGWKSEKDKILREVTDGKMPQGKPLSDEERQALLDFISSLER
ncbi:MAG: Cytochrome oxidase, cbb3-type, subunit [Pseudomonadota bacterium]|jgi:mono/diheme cytochrome c family protein